MTIQIGRKLLAIVSIFLLGLPGCLTPQPTISPIGTPNVSPLVIPAPLSRRSKLSVHANANPTGLDDFLEDAQPTIVYSLNNSIKGSIEDHSPHTLLVRRIQNDVWGRLPNDWYNGLTTDHWEADARASARRWALEKTIYVQGRGDLNLIQYAALSYQDYLAPLNEPVLGSATGDYAVKARWLDAWYQEWLTIAHSHGIKSAIYSFATGEPPLVAVPYLVGSARMAAEYGDIIDLHAYGIEGPIMTSPSSGAFWFVQFHDALPIDARPDMVISEFSSGNGYDTGLSGWAWVADSIAYGRALISYPYVLGACAFQLGGSESDIPADVLEDYGHAASLIDWSPQPIRWYYRYLPIVLH